MSNITAMSEGYDLQHTKQTQKIENLLSDMNKNYFSLGCIFFNLKFEIYSLSYFREKQRNCKDIFEYAKQEFNLEKSFVSRLRSVFERFGFRDAYGEGFCQQEFKAYSFWQLVEMVNFTDEVIAMCSPTMTIAALRGLNKLSNNKPEEKEPTEPAADDKQIISFKNDTERNAFLDDYTKLELWKEIPELQLKFYRCRLSDGSLLVVTETFEEWNYSENHFNKCSYYSLMNTERKYTTKGVPRTWLLEYFKKNKISVEL